MNYSVNHKIKDNKYFISIKCNIPNLKITQILNLRIYKSILDSGEVIQDPQILNSNYIFNINEKMIGQLQTFDFVFDVNEIINIKSIIIGFCDEFVQWNESTLLKIDLNKNLLNNFFNKKELFCMLSSWNIKCGISQYSKNIVDSLLTKKIDTKVFPHTSSYSEIFYFIRQTRPKAFIVQYEPSLILDFKKLLDEIKKLKSEKIKTKIFFIIHSEYHPLFELDGIIDGFIYHKNNTLEFKKTKIFKIPMGVPVFNPGGPREIYRDKYKINNNKIVISTLGFMFAWKNHANILLKLVPYIKDNKDLVIQYMTSFHSTNNGECIEEFNKINSIVADNNIQDNFIHITDYISQEELNERLYLSDIGFLWSGIETTSSSASLKEFVASRLPVVKTNSTHYHDIISGTITTEQNLDLFVNTIVESGKNKNLIFNLRKKMEENYQKLNYGSLINNLLGVIDA